LAKIAKISLDPKREDILDEIFTFNIAGCYTDAKQEFYKKYNKKEYDQKYLKITEGTLLWLKEEFLKK